MPVSFTPRAWSKIMLAQHAVEDKEVGFFGISDPEDLLLITDVWMPSQEIGGASVEFDDDSIADGVEKFAAEGIYPVRCTRVWIHTHPGMACVPSSTDETTWDELFGGSSWGAMVIVNDDDGKENYARVCRSEDSLGPRLSVKTPVEVEFLASFDGLDADEWIEEVLGKVREKPVRRTARTAGGGRWENGRWVQAETPAKGGPAGGYEGSYKLSDEYGGGFGLGHDGLGEYLSYEPDWTSVKLWSTDEGAEERISDMHKFLLEEEKNDVMVWLLDSDEDLWIKRRNGNWDMLGK
jgi:hypothetical protein